RVFYYMKPITDGTFGPPVELMLPASDRVAPGDRFGASVAIKAGVIVVGAPYHDEATPPAFDHHQCAVFIYEQPSDGQGFSIPGSAFNPTPQKFFLENDGGSGLGLAVAYDPANNVIVGCGYVCRFASKAGDSWYSWGGAYGADRIFLQ